MTLRDHSDTTKAQAHRILDLAKAGQDISIDRITWALVILGDYTGE
jgi:hypothetical protein